MKPPCLLATLALFAVSPAAFAQSALPAGLYEISGAVTAVTGGACPLVANKPVAGHMFYPGVGIDTTQVILNAVVPGKSVYAAFLFAFPPVPASGLNGWSGTSPVAPNYQLTKNGAPISNGEPAVLTFNLKAQNYYLAFAQGMIGIKTNDEGGPCNETVQVLLTRVAPFKQIQE